MASRRDDDGFGRNPVAAAIESMRAGLAAARARRASAGPSRRRFLQMGAAGAMGLGLPLLPGCGGGDDPVPGGGGGDTEPLTLFFNYGHLDTAGRSMSLQVGQRSYRLRPIAEAPQLLARERQRNRFLAALDDRHITHVVENVPAPQPDVISFLYGVTDRGNGQWTMDSLGILLPEAAASAGFERLRARLGAAAMPLSAKRRKYGLPPAASARDLHEEQALQDTVSHAASLLTMHKDMLALDATAANTVINGYVMQSLGVDDVDDAVSTLGTASPEAAPGVVNPTGWATLRPVPDANGQPRRISVPNDPADPANGRIVYMPVLHPTVAALVGSNVVDLLPQVQDDQTLVADVTARPAGSTLRGALSARRDGRPSEVDPKSATAAGTPVAMAVQWPNGQNHWLDLDASVSPMGGGAQQLTVSYSNTGLRYLGAFIEFLDEAGQPLQIGTMPGFADNTWITAPPTVDYGQASDTRQYIGSIASLGTVMGIPVFTDPAFYGSLGITLNLSSAVSRVRLYAGGLGSGSNNYPETIAGGVAGTMILNYVMTTLFGALGTIPDLDVVFSLAIAGGAELLAAFASGLSDSLSGNNWLTPQFWIDQGMNLLNLLIGIVGGSAEPLLKAFGAGVAALLGEAAAQSAIEKAIPIVGIVLNVESALAAVADFVLTTVTVAQSPFTYVTELAFTHDLTVAVSHDSGDSSYPRAANLMTIIATFDDGKPNRQDVPLTGTGYPDVLPPVVVRAAPYGGKVEIRIELSQRALNGVAADNILLGSGTTGLQNNDDSTAYAITIAEKPYPIGAATRYQHRQRSYLDGSGRHVWVAEAAPTTAPATFACGSAGEVCQFNGITVRQGTASTITALGYAWRGQNLGGGGDLGQQALMNADTPSAGYAISGSAKAVAGLPMALSRTAGGTNNFYVDSTGPARMIRGLTLDGSGAPSFDGPGSNRSYGMLNLPSDSLLLHPSGALISISGANDRFEVLRPPAQALTDAQAQQQTVAQVIGGSGSSPGRISQMVAATITQDGTLLVLEFGNNRVQAFDIGSNPVRYFAGAAAPYFLPLAEMPTDAGWRHLDIQADFSGLIYVLSTNVQTGVYRLSIYDNLTKLQQAVSVTEGLYAARIGLDHWRDLYTLNYQPITVQGSGAAPTVTEPSVSLWTPCTSGVSC